MSLVNENFSKLKAGYLFPEISKRVSAYKAANPDADVIRLGIGDVTRPLTPSIIKALHQGVDEMAKDETFKGYGPEQGYQFLREAIVKNDFHSRNVDINIDEVFVSDGSKCDTGNIQEIFSLKAKIAVTDPVYPVYVDTNVMAGRTGKADKNGRYKNLVYLPSVAENGFSPSLPEEHVDIIYICSPNNPTGTVLNKSELEKWVKYALNNKAIILFDAAYEAFITDSSLPHSIYEIKGAKECAIEFRSFSKTAGFTGLRCAYTVVPEKLMGIGKDGNKVSLNKLWNRRHCTKFNGVSYPVQKATEAVYSEEGKKEIRGLVDFYMENAGIIRNTLEKLGWKVFGGVNAPYIWFQTPGKISSWNFFDKLLNEVQIVGTPGSGFGYCGETYFRLSSFGDRKNILKAVDRFNSKYGK
ncbi:MAG: hypothetical protein ACD_79C00133G0005 [uncultured bacterium]|nr:MAG: hypothetical protein ACD_79C00133G0005 [uncultured bacterium]